jgi:hypothetical protein
MNRHFETPHPRPRSPTGIDREQRTALIGRSGQSRSMMFDLRSAATVRAGQ